MSEIKAILELGELKTVEFKSEYTKTILKTVSAFANYNTGRIFIGVNDDSDVIGVTDISNLKLNIENSINDNIKPRPFYEMEELSVGGKKILSVIVYRGENTPYLYSNKAYKRMDTSSIPVERIEYENLILEGRNLTFELMDSVVSKLTFLTLENKLMKEMNVGKLTKDMLKSLELIKNEKYNNAAALLSDQNPITCSEIVLIKYNDEILNIKDREILSDISIINQFDKSIEFFKKHIEISEIINSEYRKTVEEVPIVAFREALANAIVHRDYSKNVNIRIEFFNDRIEIISPGGLPSEILVDEFLDGKISIARNRIIADVFSKLKIIEKFATGIRRIKAVYADAYQKPEFEVTVNTVKVILPKVQELSKEKKVKTQKVVEYSEKTSNEDIIIEYLKINKEITRKKVEELLNLKKTQSTAILKQMSYENLLKRNGSGNKIFYTLN